MQLLQLKQCVAKIARRVAVVHWCVLRTREFDRLAFGQYLHRQPLLHQLRGSGALWLRSSATPRLRSSAASLLPGSVAPWLRSSMLRGSAAPRLRSSASNSEGAISPAISPKLSHTRNPRVIQAESKQHLRNQAFVGRGRFWDQVVDWVRSHLDRMPVGCW